MCKRPTCWPLFRLPSTRYLRALQIGVGAHEDLDQAGFCIGVALQALADGLTQMIEGGFDERGQTAAILAVAAAGSAAPTVHALAKGRQTVEHHVYEVAIAFQIGAAFVGDGVELL